MSQIGYRVGEIAQHSAFKVLQFEVYQNGNRHVLHDAARTLSCRCIWCDVLKTLFQRFGPQAKAVWLCQRRFVAKHRYGGPDSQVDKIRLPDNASLTCDLGQDGQLYVYSGELEFVE
jgi:hypothetical protein